MRSSCEGFRKAVYSLVFAPLGEHRLEMGIFIYLFFSSAGNVSTVPSKGNTGYFQERRSLLGGLSPGLTFLWESFLIQELLSEIAKNNTLSFIPCMCLFEIAFLCRPENWLQALDQTWFISQTLQVSQEDALSQCRSFNKSQAPVLLGSSLCFLPQVTRCRSLTSSPSSQQKEKRRRRWHLPIPEKQNLALNPQWIATNIS